MAVVNIYPIKSEAHLKNALDYIGKDEKTDCGKYLDSYECTYRFAQYEFAFIRSKEVIKKGNNLAWHIEQSFSPEDNVTPELAMELGKELMRRMYPNYQYVIATHIDKEHIHNHIILNSVNFEDYHKLVSNRGTLAELRKISDDISVENALSIIENNTKEDKARLIKNIDDAISKSGDFYDFISLMQEAGYQIKRGKRLSFKDDTMKSFYAASSISLDYSEAMIKHRIATQEAPPTVRKRTVWDDKIKVRSKRERLKLEIDASINRSETFEDFIADMQRKNFEVKQGEHLAFRNKNDKPKNDYKEVRFIRSKSLGYHYTEDVLRFRIEHKEEYKNMTNAENKIERVYTIKREDPAALDSWKVGKNSNIETASKRWVYNNILAPHCGISTYREIYSTINLLESYGALLEYYNKGKAVIDEKENEVNAINDKMKDLVRYIKAIEAYWTLKPIMEGYKKVDVNSLSEAQYKYYKSNESKWYYNLDLVNKGKVKYGTLSFNELWGQYNELKAQKANLQDELIRMKIEFENCENVKYNYEHKNGWGSVIDKIIQNYANNKTWKGIIDTKKMSKEEIAAIAWNNEKIIINKYKAQQAEKAQKKADRKEKIKNFFGIS